jgi:hypothetical protein
MGELREKVIRTMKCCCTVRHMMTLHIVQYSYSQMTGAATAYIRIGYINFTAVMVARSA